VAKVKYFFELPNLFAKKVLFLPKIYINNND